MIEKSLAVVLNRRDAGEADRMLTLYSRDFGRLRLFVKGLRKPKARLVSMLEPFSLIETSFSMKSHRMAGRLVNAKLISSGISIAENLRAFSSACAISEVANRLTAEADKNPRKFDLIQRSLGALSSSGEPETIFCQFALLFLEAAGQALYLQGCRKCETQDFLYLCPDQGGLLCRKHRGEGAAFAVSGEEVEHLREMTGKDFGAARPAGERLIRTLLLYLQNILGEPLVSIKGMFSENALLS